MLHKAWNSKGEMPYCFPRSSIKFQGHTVQNITNFDPNWAFPDYRPVAAFKSLRFALFLLPFCRPGFRMSSSLEMGINSGWLFKLSSHRLFEHKAKMNLKKKKKTKIENFSLWFHLFMTSHSLWFVFLSWYNIMWYCIHHCSDETQYEWEFECTKDTPYIPLKVSYGVSFVGILEKIDPIIMTLIV